MNLKYYDDAKEKDMSHELDLEFEFEETNVMEASKEEAIAAMKIKVQKLIEKLVNLDYTKLRSR